MLILTNDAVFLADATSGNLSPDRLVQEQGIRCGCAGTSAAAVARDDGVVIHIANGDIEYLDTGIEDQIECLDILSDDPLELLIGTEPPRVYLLTSSSSAERSRSFDQLECRNDWYTPWGGPPAVRSFAHIDNCVYADIHVGSIMRSTDRGTSWEPVTPDLHEDVHQVAICGAAPKRVYANTADAVFVSDDLGETWDHRAGGLSARYGRAIAVHPSDCDCVLTTVSDGPRSDVNGRLYRSDNAGGSWTHVTDGFPSETHDNIDTYHVGFSADGRAWAAVEERLYVSADRGKTWSVAWEAPRSILAIAC